MDSPAPILTLARAVTGWETNWEFLEHLAWGQILMLLSGEWTVLNQGPPLVVALCSYACVEEHLHAVQLTQVVLQKVQDFNRVTQKEPQQSRVPGQCNSTDLSSNLGRCKRWLY